jgi:putative N6-adenine-specific DNA methylase
MSDNQFKSEIFDLTAKTFHGLENILANEIKKIGGTNIKPITRAVKFRGDLELVYKANYLLRTAINILLEIKTFKAQTSEELYLKTFEIEWDNYLDIEKTFSIDNTVHSSIHTHSHFAGLKVKDAVADYFMKKFNKRPSVNTENPDTKIHLHINNEKCTISLDTSGDALFKRKYRQQTDLAPLNEILAAGMILLSDYKDIDYFYDPMCGSGTILIEAAMIFMNIPPGYFRKSFGFKGFKNYNYQIWNSVIREAEKKIKKEMVIKIIGTDINEKVVEIAHNNIANAGLSHIIQVQTKNFIGSKILNKKGLIITNPPYDVRLKSQNIDLLYKEIGQTLKTGFLNWNAYIFSGISDAEKKIGLKSDRKLVLYNGKIECNLLKFNIY